jgi:hypothetical protein
MSRARREKTHPVKTTVHDPSRVPLDAVRATLVTMTRDDRRRRRDTPTRDPRARTTTTMTTMTTTRCATDDDDDDAGTRAKREGRDGRRHRARGANARIDGRGTTGEGRED